MLVVDFESTRRCPTAAGCKRSNLCLREVIGAVEPNFEVGYVAFFGGIAEFGIIPGGIEVELEVIIFQIVCFQCVGLARDLPWQFEEAQGRIEVHWSTQVDQISPAIHYVMPHWERWLHQKRWPAG